MYITVLDYNDGKVYQYEVGSRVMYITVKVMKVLG